MPITIIGNQSLRNLLQIRRFYEFYRFCRMMCSEIPTDMNQLGSLWNDYVQANPNDALATVDIPITDEPIDWNAINAIYNLPGDNSYYYGGSYFYDPINTEPTPEVISQIGQLDDVSTIIKPTTNSTYTVQGQTAQEAWDNAKNTPVQRTVGTVEINKQTGKTGQTGWRYNRGPVYTYNFTPIAGGSYKVDLTVSKAILTLTKVVLMPQWDGYAVASQAEKDKWDTMYNKLRDHETGHETIAENGITKVANALDSQIPFTVSFFVSNLTGIDDIAQTKMDEKLAPTFDQAASEVQSESNQYDVDTNNGEN